MSEIKIADLLYVQKENIKSHDFTPWLCLLINTQAPDVTYEKIQKTIPQILEMAGIYTRLCADDMRNGIDLAIPYDTYVELVKKGIAETGYAEWMLSEDMKWFIPRRYDHLLADVGQFTAAMTLMRVGILVQILEKDPEAVIRMD